MKRERKSGERADSAEEKRFASALRHMHQGEYQLKGEENLAAHLILIFLSTLPPENASDVMRSVIQPWTYQLVKAGDGFLPEFQDSMALRYQKEIQESIDSCGSFRDLTETVFDDAGLEGLIVDSVEAVELLADERWTEISSLMPRRDFLEDLSARVRVDSMSDGFAAFLVDCYIDAVRCD